MTGSPDAELETGWLSTTPPEDTFLRRYLLNWSAYCAANASAVGGVCTILPAVRMADSRRISGYTNCATLMQPLRAETAAETMYEINAFFAFGDPAAQGEVILFSAWPTGDLSAFGWSLGGYPPIHLLPQGAAPRPAPDALRITPVRDRAGLQALERVAIEGFLIEGLDDAAPGVLAPERWLEDMHRAMWVGWDGDRPVCAASAWTEFGINDVTLVATIPEARRRGYGEAITWHAAQADPSLPAMLFSSDDGRRVYDRMGFLPLQRMTLWYRQRQVDTKASASASA